MVLLQHFEVVLVGLDIDVAGLAVGGDEEEQDDDEAGDEVDEGEDGALGEVSEEDEGDVKDVVGEEEDDEEVEGEGMLPYLAVGALDVEELLQPLLVHYHLRDVLVLVLHRDVQGQPVRIVLDLPVAAPHQQLLDDAPVPAHDGEVEGGHAVAEVLLIEFGPPGDEGVGGVLLPRVAGPVQGSAPLGILSADLHALIEVVILSEKDGTISTGESPWAAMCSPVSPCRLIV